VLCSIWFSVLCVPSVLWHCWLGHLTRKNPSPHDLYCVGRTLSLTQSINQSISYCGLHSTHWSVACRWYGMIPASEIIIAEPSKTELLVRIFLCRYWFPSSHWFSCLSHILMSRVMSVLEARRREPLALVSMMPTYVKRRPSGQCWRCCATHHHASDRSAQLSTCLSLPTQVSGIPS